MEKVKMFEKLKGILVDELNISAEDISMEAELVNDLGINSLELADLLLLCEDRFDIVIDDDDVHKLVTVGDVVTFMESAAK